MNWAHGFRFLLSYDGLSPTNFIHIFEGNVIDTAIMNYDTKDYRYLYHKNPICMGNLNFFLRHLLG